MTTVSDVTAKMQKWGKISECEQSLLVEDRWKITRLASGVPGACSKAPKIQNNILKTSCPM